MILVVDCRDSFVHNLVAILRSTGGDVVVMDEGDPMIFDMEPDSIVLSPGPGHPSPERGSWKVFERFHGRVPILGVCLGHQTICSASGGKVSKGDAPVHGKVVIVSPLKSGGLFSGIDRPFKAVRYNSLNVEPGSLPSDVIIDAYDDRGDVMAVSVTGECTYGVQFHPESFLTENGERIVENFLEEAEKWRG